MPINILDPSAQLLEHSLDLRLARQNLIASNVANAETPGYRALDLNFEDVLKDIVERQNSPAALAASRLGEAGVRLRILADDTPTMGNESNTVLIEREIGKLSQNALMFKAQAVFLGKKMAMMRAAIRGSGG